MNIELLRKHLKNYARFLDEQAEKAEAEQAERAERSRYYQSWTAKRIRQMTEEDLLQYLSKLWAMLIWGNKRYVVDKLITDNGLPEIKASIADLVWGAGPLAERWDKFRSSVKGMGPAMMSEILCHAHPLECMIWNRRAFVGMNYLEVGGLPRYDYQLTGERYEALSKAAGKVAAEMKKAGLGDTSLLAVDYFIWSELQVQDNLNEIAKKPRTVAPETLVSPKVAEFAHNDVRDKLSEIGSWLGFRGSTEVKVADGSKVDTIWESTIGNMGRVIYVFEVQTKGSIDSLIINLLKALNNPAVQGVVAVSDAQQLELIKKHAAPVKGLSEKLRCWDYTEVLDVHEKLQRVNEVINGLRLVPEGF